MNLALRGLIEALIRRPKDLQIRQKLADAVIDLVKYDLKPRTRQRRVFVLKRAAALLRSNGARLKPQLRSEVMLLAKHPLLALQRELDADTSSERIPASQVARRFGVTEAHLLHEMCDPTFRRRLGWPLPLGRTAYVHRHVFDPKEAQHYFDGLPETDPWPRATWLAGWR